MSRTSVIEEVRSTEDLITVLNANTAAAVSGMGFYPDMAQLCTAIKANTSVVQLALPMCSIADNDIVVFVEALKENKSVQRLHLGFNLFGSRGVRALVNLLRVNPRIVFIDLSGISLYDSEKETMKRLTEKNEGRMNEARNAFDSAISDMKLVRWNRSRLMVLGRERVGKTATIRSLLGETFQPEWHSTVGVALTEIRATSDHFHKSRSEARFAADLAYRAAAEVFDDSLRKDTLDSLKVLKELRRGFTKRITAIAAQFLYGEDDLVHEENEEVGHETEAEEEVLVSGERGVVKRRRRTVASELELEFEPGIGELEVESVQMSVWDYGGQRVFYGIHHLFLSPLGIYLVVFDLTTLTHDNPEHAAAQLVYWLNCIHMYAPSASTILIGTSLDRLSALGSEPSLLNQINLNVTRCLTETQTPASSVTSTSSVLVNSEADLLFYPISNRDGHGVGSLKRTIHVTARAQAHTQREVPMPWMLALDAAKREKTAWVSLDRFIALAAMEGVGSRSEALALLRFCGELGTVVHLRMSVTLSEVVVTDAQWLVDQMAKVIRDGDVHCGDLEVVRQAQLLEDWQMLFKRGLVTRDLLTFFWPAEIRDFLEEFMLKLLLISPWRYRDDAKGGASEIFLVPSMIRSSAELQPRHRVDDRKIYDGRTGYAFVFEFKNQFLPTGTFERLVCLAVQVQLGTDGNGHAQEPELTRDACRIYDSKNGAVVMRKSLGAISVRLEEATARHDFVLEAFSAMLVRIKAESFGPGLEHTVVVEDVESGDMVPIEKAKAEMMAPWFVPKTQEDGASDQRIETFLDEI